MFNMGVWTETAINNAIAMLRPNNKKEENKRSPSMIISDPIGSSMQ